MTDPASLLIDGVQELSSATSLEDVQRVVRTTARALSGADGATFVLRENGQCFYADEDAIAPLWKGLRFPMEACISGWSMLHREAVVIPDIYLDPRIPHEAYRPTFVKSLVMVPIRRRDPIGAIGTYWAAERTATREEVGALQALADSTSVALERLAAVRDLAAARSQAQDAVRDELTGLVNRRGLHLLAGQALDRVRRQGLDATLVFVDLDGLKEVNDANGHAAGDALIVRAARAMREAFDGEAVVARFGGDEFVVLHWGADVAPEAAVARLRAALGGEGDEPIPASIGSASYEPGDTFEALLAAADEAMYLDKRRRRDAPVLRPVQAAVG